MKKLEKYLPHLFAILGFVIISLLYFYPVLSGKKILQSDIVQYSAMAQEQIEFRNQNHEEPFWTNSAFGGMPTYQLGAKYPNDFVGALDDVIRFLPRPADYLFLYFLGFYVLLLALRNKPLEAFFGALAFGFSTYFIIILGVGHNAKAHAIGYMPFVVAGVLLVFQKRYWLGGILTMLATALEINANHFQMTYYLLFLLFFIGLYYVIYYLKNKNGKELLKISGVFALAVILAIGANATPLMATQEYTQFSTRGKSDLKLDENGKTKTSNATLSKEYITEYSYGIGESFNLIAPRLFGGGNDEKLDANSETYKYMESIGASPEEATQFLDSYGKTYWGNQPIVAAPAYIGAVVFFLAILALYHDRRKVKYAFLAGAILSLVLSWGKNFNFLTDIFIDYFPLYDKFRAVSSIQVILELCMPALAFMGLHSFLNYDVENRKKSLLRTVLTVGIVLVILLFGGFVAKFESPIDSSLIQMFSQMGEKSFGPDFVDALQMDRKTMYFADLLRSTFFILITAGALWFFVKNKLSQLATTVIVGCLVFFDLFFIDKKYVNKEDFVSAREVDMYYQPTIADMQILQDKSIYRVFEVEPSLTSARASYFHKSISGYSAVKPRRMQELFDYQIAKNNRNVLNLLNVKYLIQTDEKDGKPFAVKNDQALGNAWFISKLEKVNSPDDEIKRIGTLDAKNVALVSQDVKNKIFTKDSTATIKVEKYLPNYIKYSSNNKNNGFAVFSEMYYHKGWNAYIDGNLSKTPILQVDYALRGLEIPAGKHTIEFKFEPQVVKTGAIITLISSLLMLVVIGLAIFKSVKKNN